MTLIKVSDYIASRLSALTGANHVFLLSGGNMMHLLESVGSCADLTVVPMHHEQAAGIAADAYGRTRGCTGICFLTSGPGATNGVTPIAGAWMESTPLLVITGQVSRANSKNDLRIRQKGIQEVEIIPIVESITKYAVKIIDPTTIRFHLEKASWLAREGRPGPVLLDIPLDVQAAKVDPNSLQGFEPPMCISKKPLPEEILKTVFDMLQSAKRPMVILGGGLRSAHAVTEAQEFVSTLNVPVQTSWNGMDIVPENHPLFVGRAGVFAGRAPNLLIQSADLLIVLGARLGLQHTGYNVAAFGRNAKKIIVDVDSEEISKPGLNIDVKIEADVKCFLEAVMAYLKTHPLPVNANYDKWKTHCASIKERFPAVPPEAYAERFVNPILFVQKLSAVLPGNAVVPFGSSGQTHTITGAYFNVKQGQRVFTHKGLAAMGYGVPSVVGAAIASGNAVTVTLVGEGGLQLNIQELQTIAHNKLNAKVIVFNNGGYHSIHMTQKNFFQEHYVASGPESDVTFPPLPELAKLYGFSYFRIGNNADIENMLSDMIAQHGPAFCEVFVDPCKPLEPKLVSYSKKDGTMESRPLEDMAPLLSREELAGVFVGDLLNYE